MIKSRRFEKKALFPHAEEGITSAQRSRYIRMAINILRKIIQGLNDK